MRNLEGDLKDTLQQAAKDRSPSFSFDDIWSNVDAEPECAPKQPRLPKWFKGAAVGVAGVVVAAIVVVAIALPNYGVPGGSLTGASQTQANQLQQQILAENGFRITSQQQDIKVQFTLDPSWIPTKDGTTNVLHKVFYRGYNTTIYVDRIIRQPEGAVDVVINSKATYSKEGGQFVTPVIVIHGNGVPNQSSGIPWQTGLDKNQIPRFANANTGKQFILNIGSGEGPSNELMFAIQPKDVKKYFSVPVLVTIPDYNLVTYEPVGSAAINTSRRVQWSSLDTALTKGEQRFRERHLVSSFATTYDAPTNLIKARLLVDNKVSQAKAQTLLNQLLDDIARAYPGKSLSRDELLQSVNLHFEFVDAKDNVDPLFYGTKRAGGQMQWNEGPPTVPSLNVSEPVIPGVSVLVDGWVPKGTKDVYINTETGSNFCKLQDNGYFSCSVLMPNMPHGTTSLRVRSNNTTLLNKTIAVANAHDPK